MEVEELKGIVISGYMANALTQLGLNLHVSFLKEF